MRKILLVVFLKILLIRFEADHKLWETGSAGFLLVTCGLGSSVKQDELERRLYFDCTDFTTFSLLLYHSMLSHLVTIRARLLRAMPRSDWSARLRSFLGNALKFGELIPTTLQSFLHSTRKASCLWYYAFIYNYLFTYLFLLYLFILLIYLPYACIASLFY